MGLLDGKVAIVTGAGGGIGRCHALALAAEGAKVVVNDLGGARDGTGGAQAAADKVVAEIKAAGGQAAANYDSVATAAGAQNIIQTALKAFGGVDVLINNAGILRDKTLLKLEEPDYDIVLAVHLKGCFLVSQAFARAKKELGSGGAIVNTTSIAGLKGNFGQTNYSGAKGGIYSMTLTHALELRKDGIRVNAIAPIAKTRLTEDIAGVAEELKPEHISPVAIYLASDLAKEVTGRIFGVHGAHVFEYYMETTAGQEKQTLWTPKALAESFEAITRRQAAAAAAAPAAGRSEIAQAFATLAGFFRRDKAADWKAVIQFKLGGGQDQTLKIETGRCAVEAGLTGQPTCVVEAAPETILGMFQGKVDPNKAFMAGKIKASNLADMMKFGQGFDLKAAAAALANGAPTAGGAAAPAGPQAPAGPAALIHAAFQRMPEIFVPEKAGAWKAVLHFQIEGAKNYTVRIEGGKCMIEEGLNGTPTCLAKTSAAVYADILTGKMRAEKAFMEGKFTANNIGDMMKFGGVFDMKKAAVLMSASAGAAGASGSPPATQTQSQGPTPSKGINQAFIGKLYRSSAVFARPEVMRAYASATNDDNPAYLSPDDKTIVAPPLFSVRLLRDLLFEMVMDDGLNIDMLRLVHGEQDMRFHAPIRAWDILIPRAKVTGIEEKSSGQILSVDAQLYRDGEPVVTATYRFFIRAAQKAPKGEAAASSETRSERGVPDFEFEMEVTPDQSKRYADASGDNNPIHVDPKVAKAAGLGDMILQGLCTMAFTSQAVIKNRAGGDPQKLSRLAVRFAKPVFMGDTLITRGWCPAQNVCNFETVNQDGIPVIVNGVAEIH